jgi:hypothetical protein
MCESAAAGLEVLLLSTACVIYVRDSELESADCDRAWSQAHVTTVRCEHLFFFEIRISQGFNHLSDVGGQLAVVQDERFMARCLDLLSDIHPPEGARTL